ncbi:MAG: MFS transporter [Oscillospiraceae bacterium]|nr:MFS transporter [Oscillospiraceae bacterium]
MTKPSVKSIKRSKLMYIFEAAFEYLISILVNGSFLATLTRELGMSDSLTGVLSSIISLGCLFQLLSLSIRRTVVKRIVILCSIINQILFMLLYIVPLTSFEGTIRIPLFIVLIFSAYLIYNIAHPKKINWLMSLVEDNYRGSFTANKEIISLISGMVFSFVMGTVIDYFSSTGKIRVAFIISAFVIFVLMVLHSLTMLFAVEKPLPSNAQKDLKHSLLELLKNKNTLHIAVIFLLHNISTYISTPFYGTYQIGELGLSLKFVSIIVLSGSVSRILVSKFWGSYADKNSFAAMIEKCFIFLGFAEVCVIFATPSLGKVMFVLYYILHGIASGGINSALINLIFEYIPREKAADALAITQAVAGLTGFLTTLCVSPLISHIQNSGNTLFGIAIYAQQVLTIIALFFTVLAILYTRCVLTKNKQKA